MWIERAYDSIWQRPSLPVRFVTGPRQAGKSSFLRRHCAPGRIWVSLDDLASREWAEADPRMFLSREGHEWVLDEIQLAPKLLPEIKRRVDEWRMSSRTDPEPSFWLTGSNPIQIDQHLKESLAGRATYLNFLPVSVQELQRAGLSIQPESLFMRGGWPQLHSQPELDPVSFLNDYVTTVIEKDVVLTAGIQKVREFTRTVRLLAGRTAQMLVVSNIAQDSGVKQPTVTDWISILDRMQVLSLVEPFYDDANKRLLRTPKLYFRDVGLAVRLQGWIEVAPVLVSPQIGALFETLVYAEVLKTQAAGGYQWQIAYARNKEKEEIDFLIDGGNQTRVVLEVKWSQNEASRWQVPRGLRKLTEGCSVGVVSYLGGPAYNPGISHLSLSDVGDFLRANLR